MHFYIPEIQIEILTDEIMVFRIYLKIIHWRLAVPTWDYGWKVIYYTLSFVEAGKWLHSDPFCYSFFYAYKISYNKKLETVIKKNHPTLHSLT